MAEKSDRNIFTLKEFTECFDLPKWVEVEFVGDSNISLKGNGSCNIKKGMVLLLRTLAVEHVMLSFNDIDTGLKRIVRVSPDSLVKFTVLLPSPDLESPQVPRTVYETVNDLLSVCPRYFKVNKVDGDANVIGLANLGGVFTFIRKIKHPQNRRVYLQCKDPTGNIVDLPAECRGNFTAVEDEKSYTLKELLELGPVDRTLKLSPDQKEMSLITEAGGEDALYGNLSNGNSTLQSIMGLPLTYDGFITFHYPNMFLVASPNDNLQEMWKMPRSIDLNVKQFEACDYEHPAIDCDHGSYPSTPSKLCKLSELVDEYYKELPVLATLVHYQDMPVEFNRCLTPGCDVVIHKVQHYDKVLAKSGEIYFNISRNMNGRFRKILRKFNSVKDIRSHFPNGLLEELTVKVFQDVASDFPIPFSLQFGDILRFKTLKTKMHKVKIKSFPPFPVIVCKICKPNGENEKIRLPEDLEICLHEMPSKSNVDGFLIEDVFRFRPEFPFSVDYIADCTHLWGCLPVTSEIVFTNIITEALVLISPIAGTDHIDNHIRNCLLVPAKHQLLLTVKQCLGYPSSYFMFPDKNIFINVPVEIVSKQSYDELIRYSDLAYEDYIENVPKNAIADTPLPIRVMTTSTSKDAESLGTRFSRTLTNVFKNKRRSRLLNKENISNGDASVTVCLDNVTYNCGSKHSDEILYNDEGIYEHVNIAENHS